MESNQWAHTGWGARPAPARPGVPRASSMGATDSPDDEGLVAMVDAALVAANRLGQYGQASER